MKSIFSLNWLFLTGSGAVSVALRTGIGVNERQCGVESNTSNSIYMIFRGDLTEKHKKLTQNTASVHVSFMAKGFYPSYTRQNSSDMEPPVTPTFKAGNRVEFKFGYSNKARIAGEQAEDLTIIALQNSEDSGIIAFTPPVLTARPMKNIRYRVSTKFN